MLIGGANGTGAPSTHPRFRGGWIVHSCRWFRKQTPALLPKGRKANPATRTECAEAADAPEPSHPAQVSLCTALARAGSAPEVRSMTQSLQKGFKPVMSDEDSSAGMSWTRSQPER